MERYFVKTNNKFKYKYSELQRKFYWNYFSLKILIRKSPSFEGVLFINEKLDFI